MRLLRVSAISFLALVLSACTTLQQIVDVQKPTASVAGVSLKTLSLEQVTMMIDVQVDNPNGFDLKAAAFDLALSVSEKEVASISRQSADLVVKANNKGTIQLPVTVVFADVADAIGSLDKLTSVPYSLAGTVTMDLPVLGNISLPVDHNDKLPLPKLPELSLVDVSLESVDWSGARLAVALEVNNPNAFGLDVKSLAYTITSEGKDLTSGSLSEVNIAEGQTKRLDIPLNISLTNLGISLFRMLSGSDEVTVGLNATADVVPGLGIWKPAPLNFNAERKVSR